VANLGSRIAIKGSELPQRGELHTVFPFAAFVHMVTLINLLINSGSAPWATFRGTPIHPSSQR